MHRVHRGKYPLVGYERGHDVPLHVVRFNSTNQQSNKINSVKNIYLRG